jgi:hypothetical protein
VIVMLTFVTSFAHAHLWRGPFVHFCVLAMLVLQIRGSAGAELAAMEILYSESLNMVKRKM